jgi:phage shock protein PspC (stress-responsive transcriptional regulator)
MIRTMQSHEPLTRAVHCRWLGGVCEGIARLRGVPVAWVRLAFVLTGAIGGIGVLAYLACWLIIPAEDERAPGGVAPRGIASVVLGCGALVGLATLGALSAAATIFGFGWIVAVVAAAVLAGALASWPRLGPAWALLPVAALVVPSVAMAAGGVRVAAQAGDLRFAPARLGAVPRGGYESGLGTLFVDLRRTAWPPAGDVTLRIRAGLRRTLVALPHDRCVRVDVRFHIRPFAVRAAGVVTGRDVPPLSAVTVFGAPRFASRGETVTTAPRDPAAPVLHLDFTSAGGSLYVRDYPDLVDPESVPDWPGYRGLVEQRPNVTGLPRAQARPLLRSWRRRAAAQRRSAARVAGLMDGPCATGAGR